jgi:5-methylcytosine-specific restriction endonuclease McrA
MYDSNSVRRCTKCGQCYPETPEHFGQVKPGQVRARCRNCEREKNRQDGLTRDRTQRDTKRRKLEGGFRVSDAEKRLMLKRQLGMCFLCAGNLTSIESSSVDHMMPLSKGGSNDFSNLHLVHKLCNTDKKEKTVREHWEWRVTSGFDDISIGDKLGIVGEPSFK